MKKPTSAELEREANKLLYGSETVPRLTAGAAFIYQLPKIKHPYKCNKCGRPRGMFSASLCRACYRNQALKKRSHELATYQHEYISAYGADGERIVAVEE